MRLLKVMVDIKSYWHGWLAPVPLSRLPKEDDSLSDDLNITMREARTLAVNHDVVQELESLYSWRNKDPRSASSQLTLQESERFQKAVYRVWFICAMYGRPAPAPRVGKSKPKRLAEILRELGRMQAKCLQSFAPSQLALLLEAWHFLLSLATWASRAEFLPHKNYRSLEGYLVWSGPSITLQAFQGNMTSVDRKVIPSMSATYEQFCEVFKVTMAPEHQPRVDILESPHKCISKNLRCQKCSTLGSHEDLWSESNWSYLRGIFSPSKFFEYLELPWWNTYMDADSLEKVCRSVPYPQLIREVFALRSEAYESWKPEHWLCVTCFQIFIRDNIEAWCHSRGYPEQVHQ
ncbi:hypothetical protein BS17DRAFT_162512 [Gyrodon lividus]|nr:hypothetical protein BS17DRAFT_162512 [Gyrodon lividus]